MNENKSRNYKMIYLLILAFFTVVMLSSSTYAWFTSNRVVTINTINVHVAAAGGLEISADGTTWKAIIIPEDITTVHDTTYPTSVNQLPSTMEPVSTGKDIDSSTGFMQMYYGTAEGNDAGEYILSSRRIIEEEGNGVANDGKFISFDLFFKVSNDTQIYMTNNSKVTYLEEEGKGIAAATRIAFVDEGTVDNGAPVATIQRLKAGRAVYIWEPNYDVHTASAVANARDVYGITTQQTNANAISYDGVITEFGARDNVLMRNADSTHYPSYFKSVNINYYTKQGFTEYVPVFTLRKGITKVRIYMWIEGQDVDCENNASFDDILFDLQLTVNPS